MRNNEIKQSVAAVLIAVALAATVVYSAQQESKRGDARPESIAIEPRIVPEPPVPPPMPSDRFFSATIWADKRTYSVGELIRIHFRVTRPCYVYIFDTDTRGVTRQLFPNYYDPDNFCVPGGRYSIPDASYRLRVVGPPGTEHLRLVAVRYRPLGYENRYRFTPDNPFPLYEAGSEGFLQEYQRESKKVDAREQMKTRSESSRGKAEIGGQPADAPRKGSRTAESIVVEPAPRPKAIVVEPQPEPIVYDRDVAESYFRLQVIDPYVPPRPAFGEISVNSYPPGARVEVDDVVRGYTPLVVRNVPAGRHEVKVRLSGYRTFTEDVDVRPGRTAVVDVRLRPDRPRWFFGFDMEF